MKNGEREDDSANWLAVKLPNGYWKVTRPDGSSESSWCYFHDGFEAREFIVNQCKTEALLNERGRG